MNAEVTITEMTDAQAEAKAAKFPLPAFESQDDELWHCQQFVASRSRTIALVFMGACETNLRREWRHYRREALERKRFREWCRVAGARWDSARGKYLVFYPNAK